VNRALTPLAGRWTGTITRSLPRMKRANVLAPHTFRSPGKWSEPVLLLADAILERQEHAVSNRHVLVKPKLPIV